MSELPLKDICEISAGQPAPQDEQDFSDKGIPFVRAGSLEPLLSGKDESNLEKIDDVAAKKHRLRIYPKDTILFAKSGMSAKIGRVYRLKSPAYIVSHLAAVIPGNKIDPSYLQRWFEFNPPSKLIPNDSYPSIRTSEIERLKILLPSLSEQKRIAAILDKAETIRRKRTETINLLNEFQKSLFLDMFGDPVRNEKGWNVEKLGDLLDFMTSGSRGWAQYYSNSGDKFLRINNVGYNELKLDDLVFVNAPKNAEGNRTKVKQGDVLLSITADLGRSAVIPENFGTAYINQHLALLRLKNHIPEFISAYFASEGGQAQIKKEDKGGVKAGLNFNDIRNLKIYLPPIEMQQRYRSILGKIIGARNLIKNKYEDSNILFQSLTHRAFKGEL